MEEVSQVSDRHSMSFERAAPRLTVSTRYLLGIYWIVPACFLVMVLDRLFGGGHLATILPRSPVNFILFQIVFGYPHIMASTVILFSNRSYFDLYRLRIVVASIFLVLFIVLGKRYFPGYIFLMIFGAVTVLHVIKQQIGVGKGICRISRWVYDAWGWSLILFGAVMYFLVFSFYGPSPLVKVWVYGALWILGTLALVLTIINHLLCSSTRGRLFLWANLMMVLQSILFYRAGYPFLAIIAPRLVHDLTAFTFYVAHDVNRHFAKPQNLLYRLASKLRLGIYWVCPVVAVLLTYLISYYANPLARFFLHGLGVHVAFSVAAFIFLYFSLLHYYTESFTWKVGSVYRKNIRIK